MISIGMHEFIARRQMFQFPFVVHSVHNSLSQLHHCIFLISTDIENLIISFFDLYRFGNYWCHIINVAECSCLLSIAKHSQAFALHQLIHKNADHISVAITYVLKLTVNIVWPKDDALLRELR